MNMSGVGAAISQNQVGGSSKDVEKQIKVLEEKKVKLQQEMEKEDSPFALSQSKEYDAIKKKIEDIDKQIQQLKASATGTESAAEVSASSESQNNGQQNKNTVSTARQFDEFVRSEDQPKQDSAGIYSVSSDENGKAIISFNQHEGEKGLAKEDDMDDKLLLKTASDKVKGEEEEIEE